jgi:hypothetical protein
VSEHIEFASALLGLEMRRMKGAALNAQAAQRLSGTLGTDRFGSGIPAFVVSLILTYHITDTALPPDINIPVKHTVYYFFTDEESQSDSSSTISSCPFCDPNSEGVLSSLSRTWASAPRSSNNRTISVCPFSAAQ